MRRVGVAIVLCACACNLISGASSLEPSLDDGCVGIDCLPDGGRGDGSVGNGDGALSDDANVDGGEPLVPGGFLDTTYGKSGIVKSGLLSQAYAVAVDSIGRAYVVGQNGSHLSLVRFTSDGNVDTTFGSSGRLDVPMGNASGGSLPNIVVPDALAGIAIDALDRVVIGGTSQENFLDPNPVDGGAPIPRYERYLYAARIKDGALDATFGQGGKYRPNPVVNGEGARAVLNGPNGTTLLVGSSPSSSFTVWRLTTSGNADPEFGSGGRSAITVPNAGNAIAAALAGTSILAAGSSNEDFGVAQLGENGTPASGFGDGGVAIAKPGTGNDQARSVAVVPDGRIIVAGAKGLTGVRDPVFAVARLTSTGAVDTSFGMGGVATFDFDVGGTWKEIDEELHGLVIDGRNRAVVAGYVLEKPQTGPGFYRTVLARLKEDGTLDSLFGNGGKVSFTDLPDSKLRGTALARASNGSLFVAGAVDGAGEVFVARVVP